MAILYCRIKESDFFLWGMTDMKEVLRLMVEWYVEAAGVNSILYLEPFFNPFTNHGVLVYEMGDDNEFPIHDMEFYLNDKKYTMEFY